MHPGNLSGPLGTILRCHHAKQKNSDSIHCCYCVARMLGSAALKKSSLEALFEKQLMYSGINGFIREHYFHPTRRWRFDFCWKAGPLAGWAVELQGGTEKAGSGRGKSGHTTVTGYRNDCEKMREAQRCGWKIAWFTTQDVRQLMALRFLEAVIVDAEKECQTKNRRA